MPSSPAHPLAARPIPADAPPERQDPRPQGAGKGRARPRGRGRLRVRPTQAKIIYGGLATLVVVSVVGTALYGSGFFSTPASELGIPWALSVVLVGVLTTTVFALVGARRIPEILVGSGRSAGGDPLAAWEPRVFLLALLLSALFSFGALLAWAGLVPSPGPRGILVLSTLGILGAFVPPAALAHWRAERTRSMEERFPALLRDLNESYAAGLTMAQAIRHAARGDYGRLTPEVGRMAMQVSWGVTFQDALRLFAERVPTPAIERTVSLIIKATDAGGDFGDVLAAAARDTREMKALEAERRTNMALYAIVIYVAFGVFLAVTAALQGLLVPSVLGSTSALQGSFVGGVAVNHRLTLLDFEFIFYGVGLVQAIGSGLVAGVMSEGTLSAGLKHASVLVATTLLVLGVLL